MHNKSITIINQVAQLEVLANTLERISYEWNIPMDIILSLNLVIEELVTNIIFYGYDDKNEHEINIHLSYKNKLLQMQIEDDGKEFNPLLVLEPEMDKTIENSKIGGLGIHFVRKIMDDISYQRSNNKNKLTLTKRVA
jgi:serine/threonine-protein kinase RsbW